MTSTRSFLFAFAAAALALVALPACGVDRAGDGEDTSSSEGALLTSLEEKSVVKASVVEGGAVTVAYEPSATEYAQIDGLPFIGVELVKAPAVAAGGIAPRSVTDGGFSVSVTGEFPGEPLVLVVDESFHILAKTHAVSDVAGDHASLSVPATLGRSFLLVRDDRWVRPMTFEVRFNR